MLKIGGSSLPIGIVINRATIIGIIPINSNKFLSSNFLASGPTDPKQATATIPPIAILMPKYLTVSSRDHPHISMANGVATLEIDKQVT